MDQTVSTANTTVMPTPAPAPPAPAPAKVMPHQRSCDMAVLSCAASNLAYGEGRAKELALDLLGEESKLQDKGWTLVEQYQHEGIAGKDRADLWKNALADNCMLVFRGTDDLGDIVNDFDSSTTTFQGVDGVHSGVARELEELLDAMEKKAAKDFISEHCASSFVVSGHSLGGAVAQLFSVLVNRRLNPLGWMRKVDAVYVFGSMPVAKTHLDNEMREDGCFPGGSYVNKMWGIGHDITDFAYGFPFRADLKHVQMSTLKVDFFESQNFKNVDETPCGSEIHFNPLWTNALLHMYLGAC